MSKTYGPGWQRCSAATTSNVPPAGVTSGLNQDKSKPACSTEAFRDSAAQPRTAARSCHGRRGNENHGGRSVSNCGRHRAAGPIRTLSSQPITGRRKQSPELASSKTLDSRGERRDNPHGSTSVANRRYQGYCPARDTRWTAREKEYAPSFWSDWLRGKERWLVSRPVSD